MNLRPPSVTVSIHTSVFKAVAFQSPAMPNARMSLWTQPVHSFSFPHRPLRTAPSRFPKTIRFGGRRRSFGGASPPTKVFSFATWSQCCHTRLSQEHGCTKSSDGLVSCAVPRLYEARLGGVRCGVWRSVPGEGSTYCMHTRG